MKEFVYALQNRLSFEQIRNQMGEFVAANIESISADATHSAPFNCDFKGSVVDAAVGQLLTWIPGRGQSLTAGYAALPEDVITREKAAIH